MIDQLHPPKYETLLPSVALFPPVSLAGLDKVKLMNRVDSKYIFHRRHLDDILSEISKDYTVLEINEKRVFDYASLYFDTPNYALYLQHHNGKNNRVKLRYRQYMDTGDVFFEVKKKVKGTRTDKYRVRQPAIEQDKLGPDADQLMSKLQVVQAEQVEGKTWIYYKRITLAANATEERVTIDLDMRFKDAKTELDFPELVIAEVKQAKLSRHSPIVVALHKRRIPDFRISKYSLAVAMMVPGIKIHLFKAKINRLHKILSL
jgi:hypothetical protein